MYLQKTWEQEKSSTSRSQQARTCLRKILIRLSKKLQSTKHRIRKKKEAIDARNDADNMVFQTEKALEEAGDKISDSEKTTVQADITKVKEILDRTTPDNMTDADVSEINEAKEQLMKDAQTLFAKMYEQAQQGAQGGPTGSTMAEMPTQHTMQMMWLTQTIKKFNTGNQYNDTGRGDGAALSPLSLSFIR